MILRGIVDDIRAADHILFVKSHTLPNASTCTGVALLRVLRFPSYVTAKLRHFVAHSRATFAALTQEDSSLYFSNVSAV